MLLAGFMSLSVLTPMPIIAKEKAILPDLPKELQGEYEYYETLSDEFNGSVEDMWLMDYMPWWSDTAKREQSGTKTRYRFIDAKTENDENNQSLQIYVNGENRMGHENFQPYYLEMLSGPQNLEPEERYLANKSQKNNWNSKFAGFMAGSKNYLNTYRGSEAPIQSNIPYSDAGATTYGYFETRCKFLPMKSGQGLAPAFWFIGMQDDVYDRGEVDVFEFLDNYTLDFTIHPKGDPRIEKVTHQIKFEEDMSKDYHTYGLLWDSTGFSLYVDGEFKWKHNQKIDYRMIPMFSINHHENGWIGSVDGANHPEERTMDIDYFRTFKKVGEPLEPNKPTIPEMKEGENIASAAYMSLFGMTGTEVDETPVQWLNDSDRKNSVLSGLDNKKLTQSKLPEYLYIDWKQPATFNTIVLHAQNAKSQAPTLLDIQISKDGETWETIQSDISLQWTTDSQLSESQTIVLNQTVKDNLFTRLVIKEANMKNGRFGLCEIEIGENITAMEPEYLPLPDKEITSIASENGLQMMINGTMPSSVKSYSENNTALYFQGKNTDLKIPLKDEQGNQIHSDEDFTLSMWIKPDAVTSGNDQIILFQQTGTNGGKPWLFLYQNRVGTYIDGENRYGTTILQPNEWIHLATTFEKIDAVNGKLRLYVNGQLDLEETIDYTKNPDHLCDAQAVIGKHKSNSKGWYNGAIDQLLLLNTAATPDDIKTLYETKELESSLKDTVFANWTFEEENLEYKMYDATSVLEIDPIEIQKGETTLEDLLPTMVSVVFESTYVSELPVMWNQDELNAIDINKAGSYQIHGTIDFSGTGNTTNTKNLNASLAVTIKDALDASELKKVVNEINQKKEQDYTEESWALFLTACQAVQTKETLILIGSHPNYQVSEILPTSTSQEVLDRMCTELQAAIKLLVEKPQTIPPIEPEDPDLPQEPETPIDPDDDHTIVVPPTNEEQLTPEQTTPDTSDSTNLTIYMMLMVVSGLGLLIKRIIKIKE